MIDYTVEVTTPPMADMAVLRRVLDTVPGSVLEENPEEPILYVSVEADSPTKAAMFVDGLSVLMRFTIVSTTIYPTPDDFGHLIDAEDDDVEGPNEVVSALEDFADSKPEFHKRFSADGSLQTV